MDDFKLINMSTVRFTSDREFRIETVEYIPPPMFKCKECGAENDIDIDRPYCDIFEEER